MSAEHISTTFPRRRVGTTDLEVSVMALGAAPLGGLFRASSQRDASETIAAALDGGINFLDVAPLYGEGLAEQRVGVGLSELSARDLVLSTKVGRLLEPTDHSTRAADWAEGLFNTVAYNTTPDGIRRSLKDSIARLRGARPSVLLLHDPDRNASPADLPGVIAEAYETMSALRKEGAVTAIGLGVNAP